MQRYFKGAGLPDIHPTSCPAVAAGQLYGRETIWLCCGSAGHDYEHQAPSDSSMSETSLEWHWPELCDSPRPVRWWELPEMNKRRRKFWK